MNLFERPTPSERPRQSPEERTVAVITGRLKMAASSLRAAYDHFRREVYHNPRGLSSQEVYAALESAGMDTAQLGYLTRAVKTLCNQFGAGIDDDVPEVTITDAG